MDLLIVESPAKAKKISGMFSHLKVVATVGHFRDLPPTGLGVQPPEFKPEYLIDSKKNDVVKRLRSAANAAQIIYVATDPDREGEAIAMHVEDVLGNKHRSKLRRVTYSEVSKQAIEKAIKRSGKIDYPMVRAQEARRVIDRLVGYLVSPALMKKMDIKSGISAGRVQSAGLKLVVVRQREIEAFKPEPFFTVVAHLDTAGHAWRASWDYKTHAEKHALPLPRCASKEVAEQAADVKEITIISCDTTRTRVAPPAPLTTSALLKAAAGKLKFTATKTMQVAQKLFEAGAITYHRTDSPVIDPEYVAVIRQYAAEHDYPLPEKPITKRAKAGAQEAHEAVRVTNIADPQGKFGASDPETLLYKLIWLRTLQSQLAPGADDKTQVKMTGNNGHPYIAKGSQVITQGWRSLSDKDGPKEDAAPIEEQALPRIQTGSVIPVADAVIESKMTRPPGAYTEVTLIEELEKREIGRPSTYASIINTLIDRKYVNTANRKFKPTQRGADVFDQLEGVFGFMELEFTAEVEAYLDLIAQGKARYIDLVTSQFDQLCEDLRDYLPGYDPLASSSPKKEKQTRKEGEQCSACKAGTLTLKAIQSGDNKGKRYFGCSTFNFKDKENSCDFFEWQS